MFTSIILIHELGHFLTAEYYKWDVDKIYLYPYGGLTKFSEELNRPLKEEWWIMLMGPIFQIVFFMCISKIVSFKDLELFKNYHYGILFFNLLPIYPLDGGKLLNIIFSYFISFKASFKLVIFISYLIILTGVTYLYVLNFNVSFSLIMMIFLILCKLTMEHRKENYYFNKFILERYIRHYEFPKTKVIKKINEMQRDRRHVFKKGTKYYSEKEIIHNKFRNK